MEEPNKATHWRGDNAPTPLNPPQIFVRKDSAVISILGSFQELSAALISAGASITDIRGLGLFLSIGVEDSFDRDKELWGAPGFLWRLLGAGVLATVAAQDIT